MAASTAEIVFITDKRVLAIPVKECKEPWVNLQEQSVIEIGPSPEIPNNTDYFYMRNKVYEKLVQAQTKLPSGLRFCLYEAYRSLELQKILYDGRYAKVKHAHPDWSHEDLHVETTRLVSPVVELDGTPNIPPHATGAAVDVYLLDENGDAIDMGMHPKDWQDDVDGSLSVTHSDAISETAQKNRDIMSKVLSEVGFVNYPTEFWHWSYGDRYWAYHTQQPYALYGMK